MEAGLGVPFVLITFIAIPIALAGLGLRSLRREPPRHPLEDEPPS